MGLVMNQKGGEIMGWIILAILLIIGAGAVVHHVDHTDDGMYGICQDAL